MTDAYKKEVTIDDGTTSVTLGGTQFKEDYKNKLSASPIAQENSGETKNLALNLNRIKHTITVSAKVSDSVASALNSGDDKETVHDDLLTIFKSQNRVTLTYGSRTFKGFLNQLNVTENADQDASLYSYKIRLLESEDMAVE